MEGDRDDPGPRRSNRGRYRQRGGRRGAAGGNNSTYRWPREGHLAIDRRPQRPIHAAQLQGMLDAEELPRRDRSPLQPRRQFNRANNHPGGFRNQDRFIGEASSHNRDNNAPNANRRGYKEGNIQHHMGFRKLEELAKSATDETLPKLMQSKTAFMELVDKPIESFDIFVLTMEIMARVCQSSFDETKSKILIDVCNSNFIVSLKSYLMDLPYTQNKLSNQLYWNNQQSFWENFVKFCECIVNTSPTLALNKCRSLLETTPLACLDGLKNRHGFTLNDECTTKMTELRERLELFENHHKEKQKEEKNFRNEHGAPPENFRELSITPTREDLLVKAHFIRPNIVNGSYQDVEHYLDVQFRLLREDCFGPLRDGLNQYLQNKLKRKYDNIRVFHNVKFVKPYLSQTKLGSLVQIDVNSNKMFKKTNWSNNKRFIYGSLVLFSKDDCRNFIVATIMDRDESCLAQGLIPVSLIGHDPNQKLYNDDSYIMIESEVYYEPYYHVLKVLKDPTFPQNLAMKQYIVDVDPHPHPPSYLTEITEFVTEIDQPARKEHDDQDLTQRIMAIINTHEMDTKQEKKFTVLQEHTWPGKDALGFNDSQYEAFKLALTHEFAVIQGPPGTGKTYLGIKVAKILIENLKGDDRCLMLVICYTNHALDQFLEALMDFSDSIVRIGGQSRNEAMSKINLTNLRRTQSVHSRAHNALLDQKLNLKRSIAVLQTSLAELDALLNGVVKSKTIESDLIEVNLLCKFFMKNKLKNGIDPLYYWLFQYHTNYYTELTNLFEQTPAENDFVNHEKESRKRTGVILEEQEDNNLQFLKYRKTMSIFHIEDITSEINKLVTQYRATDSEEVSELIEQELQRLHSLKTMYNEMATQRFRRMNVEITEQTDFLMFSAEDRWSLYYSWIHNRTAEAKRKVELLQAEVDKYTDIYEESRMMMDLEILKGKKIVGMTTSGAARLRKLLQTLNPPIVIVEEAAEVLEQHIICSLTAGCKHLILIGDHQQLRPSASHVKLARHFGLEVSLFERMITNGIHSRKLCVQHRMRPEIAALICPHIYNDLVNHPSVYDFPDVKGITKNLFFYSHEFKEDVVSDNMSRTNQNEADITLGLANYLMQQGYEPGDITILAAYKGQMFYMRKHSDQYTHLKGVKITVVDNYQGEESKIILLSLVRNNEENKIGFLGTANRICVALSRAKYGFYIFGNIDTLKASSEIWSNIAATLERTNSIGTNLTLQCQIHSKLTTISNLADFQQVPEGGCMQRCEAELPGCGHKCLLFCHGYDHDHLTPMTKCRRSCERTCELNHVCPKKCSDKCGPCEHKVLKKLPCGHEMKISCYLEPDDPSVKCQTIVEVTLPDCKHEAKKLCFEKVKDIRCGVQCIFRIEECGHSCEKKCHVNEDPHHEKYQCTKPCARPKRGCRAELIGDRGDHQCLKMCHNVCDPCEVKVKKKRTTCKHTVSTECRNDPDTVECHQKCGRMLPCEHFCRLKCKEKCGECAVMVKKVIPLCNHEIIIPCKTEATREHCIKKCERIMRCGHRCKDLCSVECNPSKCIEPLTTKMRAPCGHDVALPCNTTLLPAGSITPEMLLEYCTKPCGAVLACKHLCAGTCAECHQCRLHKPCGQPCNQINICGHQCEEPCNQICPPCKKKCEVKCQHSQCKKLCGAPCTLCTEKCGRVCPHGSCKNRCGEACSIEACSEPCGAVQTCGHPCRGLCGDPCPSVCRVCKPDDFPVDFLGDAFEEDDRFILLEDCGHVMEIENMNNLMTGDSETVKIHCCPYCRQPIINTRRYKDLVNAKFRNEINPIKKRVYGTEKDVKVALEKLNTDVKAFSDKYLSVLQASKPCKLVFSNLLNIMEKRKKIRRVDVSKLQLDMESICLNILDMISECYDSYTKIQTDKLNEELQKQIKLLCDVFVFKGKKGEMLKVSQQQQNDVKLEIRRLNSIVQLAKLTKHLASVKMTTAVTAAVTAAKAAVFKPAVFVEEDSIAALKKLESEIKVSGIVTSQERDLIVKAIGLKAGHWYKCPNGHFYCIGECGGAMEESRCVECGVRIGGRGHRLLEDNAHAPEMDGSRFAAWSEEYNNMANFRLD